MKISSYRNIGIIFNKDSGLINNKSVYSELKEKIENNRKCIVRNIPLENCESNCNFYSCFKYINIAELKKCDVVIVLGGDGTKNFIANMLIHYNIDIPILGISYGTMNVGKLSTICYEEFNVDCEYDFMDINALSILIDEKHHYYAFHDIIFSTTFVGNNNGKITQLSAKKMINGEKEKGVPDYIGDNETRIHIKRFFGFDTNFPICDKIGISELNKGLVANVMAGGLDHPATLGVRAGIIMSPERFVWPSRTIEEYQAIEPVLSYTASFDYNDEVNVIKLKNNACFIIDGNALSVTNNQYAKITLIKNAVKILIKRFP